ncbi:hypothetical protein COB57_00255 [Candidatus Peregrinibacteria bacterium]|nr:MAG: hypothetical protein COB57_00255 [Candidatus Peregrinibacteria bacterium]
MNTLTKIAVAATLSANLFAADKIDQRILDFSNLYNAKTLSVINHLPNFSHKNKKENKKENKKSSQNKMINRIPGGRRIKNFKDKIDYQVGNFASKFLKRPVNASYSGKKISLNISW